MSEHAILGRFCKSGDWHHLSRRFHNLDRDAKQKALADIANGADPKKAIERARKRVSSLQSSLSF
jgi:hypothetical protein